MLLKPATRRRAAWAKGLISSIGLVLSFACLDQELEQDIESDRAFEPAPAAIVSPSIVAHGASMSSPEPLGLGRLATESEIAAWDIDVRPDGKGLPEGRGSIDAGREIYAVQCQHCHGADGRGGPFDRLAGRIEDDGFPFETDPTAPRTIGSYWPYATTLFDYIRRAMPLERPGSLADEAVYALTAYLLHLNGLLETGASLDRGSLVEIVMPARDRFVKDDRTGGEEIR